jgi:LlaJI restriction endonuclease.
MIELCKNDGSVFDKFELSNHHFFVDESQDVKKVFLYNSITGERVETTQIRYDFVGFVTNEKDDILFVYPKHLVINNAEEDAKLTLDCIMKSSKRRADLYYGDDSTQLYKSNYPFAAFYAIYNYYLTHGLFREDREFIKKNGKGKINWKFTISKSNKYLINGDVVPFPFYNKQKYYFSNFITECMIFAIDYTYEKFGFIMDINPTGEESPDINFSEDKEYIINVLQQLKHQTFKDDEHWLINNLIEYFSKTTIGGNYFLKCHEFSVVWEDMARKYLCDFYKCMSPNNEIIFDKNNSSGISFTKKTFYPNKSKPTQKIEPDYYAIDGNSQLIFDAKYFNEVSELDYKQVAYVFILKEYNDICVPPHKKFDKTYSALILPSNLRKTLSHFELQTNFTINNSDIFISEEYIDIRETMLNFIGKM